MTAARVCSRSIYFLGGNWHEQLESAMESTSGKVGWLHKKRLLGRPKQFFFQVDFSTVLVSYFTDDIALGPKLSKLAGSFSVRDAALEPGSARSASGTEYTIVRIFFLLTSQRIKGPKANLTVICEQESVRDEWLQAFRTSKHSPRIQEQLARFSPQEQTELADAGLLPSDQQIEEAYAAQEELDEESAQPPDFWHIDVLDKNGRAVKFGSVLRARATVVIVLRHFGCILCREIVPRITRFRSVHYV